MAEDRTMDVAAWFEKLDDDLEAARMIHRLRGPAGVGCFLCQQAVEKALKACLVAQGAVPPKIHDLEALADAVRDGTPIALEIAQEMLQSVTDYAVAERYPGFGDSQTQRDFPQILAWTEDIVARVRAALSVKSPASG